MLPLLLLLQSIAAPAAASVSNQGREVVDLFGSMCVETALSSNKAHLLDAHPEVARTMTPEEREKIMPGGVVAEGWITRSPHDAWAALWFAPSRRTCGVTVRAADPAGMEAALDARLRTFYDTLGATVAKRPDETSTESDVVVHRASWTVDIGSHQVAVIASFGDKPIGATQHMMTFTMLH